MTSVCTVLFITDSLGFPRLEPEAVKYEDTYLALLKQEFPQCDFIHQGRGGATIVDLFKHSAYYHDTLSPDLVFIQSGIVDCAPRALTVIEQQVVSRLPLVSGLLTALVKKHSVRLRRARGMTYTPLAVFREYKSRFESLYANLYWICILPASAAYEAKLEGIQRNVERYNSVLIAGKHVATEHFDTSKIMSDHHHLNRAGHRTMFENIAHVIRHKLTVVAPKSRKAAH